jgi:hypothetical protein
MTTVVISHLEYASQHQCISLRLRHLASEGVTDHNSICSLDTSILHAAIIQICIRFNN